MQTKWIRSLLNLGLLLLLVFSSASTVLAQSSDAQVRITQVDNSQFPNVTLYVSVTNSAGEPVGVDPATIQISENGETMQIVDAQGGGEGGQGVAEPLTTMLVIDISGTTGNRKAMNFTRITFIRMRRTELNTTLCVAARPTPAAPPVAL